MSEILKFTADWTEFYNKLTDTQKAHFLELIDKYKHFFLYDIIDIMEDMEVIVK